VGVDGADEEQDQADGGRRADQRQAEEAEQQPGRAGRLRVPIGKVSHDPGTPALAMPGRIGRKWARAAMPEKALAATATRVTTRTAVPMRMLRCLR
jgi:hypothetical protein